MKTIKIYSQKKPFNMNGKMISCEVYTVNSLGVQSGHVWYSELKVDDYFTTRLELEQIGFTAHPASTKEIENSIYSIFKETV